jgi:hypothetical protein
MSVDPQLTSVQAFNNPYNTNKTLYIAANTSTANKGGVKVSGTNASVNAGGLSIGTGLFTIECYAYMTASGALNILFEQTRGGQSIAITSAGNIQLAQSYVAYVLQSSVSFPLNTWTHIAWVRDVSMNRLFIDGSMRVAFGSTNNFQQEAGWDVAYVGGGSPDGTTITSWPGYICGLRYSRVARYSSNFVAPTTPFRDDANTLLLVQGGATNLNSISDDNT